MPVTWTDTSGVAHEIAQCTPSACPGSPASTGTNTFDVAVPADGHGSFTFTIAGTYYYYCSIHGYVAMHGTIVVTAAATPPPVPSATPRPTARPTHAPVMQSATARPTASPDATAPAHATTPTATTPSATNTPEDLPSISGTPPTSTPSPHAVVTLVSSGGSPAVPIALVIAVLVCLGIAVLVSVRNRNR